MTTRSPADPAAILPRDGRAARALVPGGPAAADSPREAAAGGTIPPQRTAAGTPPPDGGADPACLPVPLRGRPQSPAGGGQRRATGASPAGSIPLSGEEFRAVWKRERAERAKGQRGDQGRRARRAAAKATGARYRPGMTRREPPGPPEDAA